jgi:tetratricopeptide (TPR) repeat protein
MRHVYYLCVAFAAVTLGVIVWKWQSSSRSSELSPETVRMIRDKLSESCNRISENNYDQAREIFGDVLRLDPDQPIALYDFSVLDTCEGNLTNAHALLVKALKHADQAKVKQMLILLICHGELLSAVLPEDGDDSGLKHNPKEASGRQVFLDNGESMVREVEGVPDLHSFIQNHFKS